MLDVRSMYGGLGSLLRAHAGDIFVHGGKSGADVWYESLLFQQQGDSSQGCWDAFVHPHSRLSLWIEKESNKLVVRSRDAGEEALQIAKITDEEHLEIARSFTDSVEPGERIELLKILARPDYWNDWSTRLARDRKTLSQWLRHRRERIIQLFVSRLTEAKVSVSEHENLVDQLSSSTKTQQRRSKTDRRELDGSSTTRLREQLKLAIDQMSESELRQVWIPAGAVFRNQ